MKVLVTGSAGMIGRHLVPQLLKDEYEVVGIDKKKAKYSGLYEHFVIDLGNKDSLEHLFEEQNIDRVIHLAALAHAVGGKKYTKEMYEYLNVDCANNIFKTASMFKIPVLFISTVDVYGFQKGVVNSNTTCKPVTIYGKTKYQAEQLLKKSGCPYTIFRFSPVYTEDVKRDIQKRIYLKYPNWAYQIGKNTEYEVLSIDKAVDEMTDWCNQEVTNDLKIVKDTELLQTQKYIIKEKKEGRAKHIVRLPKWLVLIGYGILRITGKNKYTFLINKAVHPLRSE